MNVISRNNSFSIHKIVSYNDLSFDPSRYSRFKFGDGAIAKEYGKVLAKEFAKEFAPRLSSEQEIVVLSYTYTYVQTASSVMGKFFLRELNRILYRSGHKIAQEAKMIRKKTFYEDYGSLSEKERIKLIYDETLDIDYSKIENKLLIFIDDIKITGSHQRLVERSLEINNVSSNLIFVYFAELVNTSIHPNLENYLNYYSVKDIDDLNFSLNSNSFYINARFVKYILSREAEEIEDFIQDKPLDFIEEIFDTAICNNYQVIPKFAESIKILNRYAD